MKQIISELHVFEGQTESNAPLKRSMENKTIINNPLEHKSGNFVLDGDIFNSFTINNINYIHLIGNSKFSIVLDSKVVLFTRQFTFMNTETTLNIRLFPSYFGKTDVKYTTGFTGVGTTDSPVEIIGDDGSHDFDEELRNMLVEMLEIDPILNQYSDDQSHQYDSILEDIIVDV